MHRWTSRSHNRMHPLILSSTFPLLLGYLAQATALHIPRVGYVVHETRVEHPSWTRTRRLEGDVTLPLRIGLKQRNLDLLPDYLMSVSDPGSPSYGQHWTLKKVVETFAPEPEARDRVHAWLAGSGFEETRVKRSANQAWIEVRDATASEVEQLLDARYHVYKGESEEHVAADSYSLPRSIAEVVDIITPTIQPRAKMENVRRQPSPLAKRADISATGPVSCDIVTTPDCLKTLYNMTYTPTATDQNTLGIVSFYPNTYLQSDLDMFFRNFSPASVGKSPELVSINGGSIEVNEASSAGETGYILQYAMTFVEPQSIMLLQVEGQQTGRIVSFNGWLDAVDDLYCTSDGGDDFTYDPTIPSPFPGGLTEHTCGVIQPPNVVSNSQADHEYRFSQFYLQRQCNEFAKLGLMGVTIIYSAGNAGVSGAQSGVCLDQNGSMNRNATKFNPAWPASCPWVTAVGGTQVKANTSVSDLSAEEVWNEEIIPGVFESGGGGFSNRFPIPNYQKDAVKTFLDGLKKIDPALLKNFNTKGRAFPDLSANSHQFLNIDNGTINTASGTSGAVPTIAAIITLVNDARITAGKKPVGFINPTIYSSAFASAFNDITSGTNQGCRGLEGDSTGGFKAGKGWDPATGVGTPNLGLLIEKWLTLP